MCKLFYRLACHTVYKVSGCLHENTHRHCYLDSFTPLLDKQCSGSIVLVTEYIASTLYNYNRKYLEHT